MKTFLSGESGPISRPQRKWFKPWYLVIPIGIAAVAGFIIQGRRIADLERLNALALKYNFVKARIGDASSFGLDPSSIVAQETQKRGVPTDDEIARALVEAVSDEIGAPNHKMVGLSQAERIEFLYDAIQDWDRKWQLKNPKQTAANPQEIAAKREPRICAKKARSQ